MRKWLACLLVLVLLFLLPVWNTVSAASQADAPVETAALSGNQEFDVTVLPETYQTVEGWGITPGSSNRIMKFTEKTAAHDAIYRDLGITMFRMDFSEYTGDENGNLVQEWVDHQADYITKGVERGISRYLLTIWSPPEGMKNFNPARLKVEKEPVFVQYIVNFLNALTARGLPAPYAVSLQNEPANGSGEHLSSMYTAEQYVRVAKLLRTGLDAAGYGAVKLIGPEAAHYTYLRRQLGENFEELDRDPEFADALDAIAVHSYILPSSSQNKDMEDFIRNASKYPDKERWQTEFSTAHHLASELEIDRAISTMRVFSSDMAWAGHNVWMYWWGYDPRQLITNTNQQTLVFGDGISSVDKGRLFQALSQIFNHVPPGSQVKRMSTTDPAAANSIGLQNDMVAFETENGTVALLVNPSDQEKVYHFHGLSGKSAVVRSIAESFEGMQELALRNIQDGSISQVRLPASSVNILITSNEDSAPPQVSLDENPELIYTDGRYISRNRTIAISGRLDEPGTVTINGNPVTVDGEARFSYDLVLDDGLNQVVIEAADTNQNKAGDRIVQVEYKPDYVGIVLQRLADRTNQTSYRIKGRVNAASVIRIQQGDHVEELDSAQDLTFEHVVQLAEGSNTFRLSAEDAAGNQSAAVELTIECDSLSPIISLFDVRETTEDTEYIVYGSVSELAGSITINETSVLQSEDGTFEGKVTLSGGSNRIVIQASDLFGNQGQKELTVVMNKTPLTPQLTNGISYTRRAAAPISVDGDLSETGWIMDNKANKSIFGVSNNIVNFGTLWDDDNLYVGVRVYDNKKSFGSARQYLNDCIELFFNPGNGKEGDYQGKDQQVFMGYLKDRSSLFVNKTPYEYKWKDYADGYSVEMAIPWSSLELEPASGLQIGFDLANDDQDVYGDNRQSITGWAGTADNWKSTANFGTLILTDETMPASVLRTLFDDNYVNAWYTPAGQSSNIILVRDNVRSIRDSYNLRGKIHQLQAGETALQATNITGGDYTLVRNNLDDAALEFYFNPMRKREQLQVGIISSDSAAPNKFASLRIPLDEYLDLQDSDYADNKWKRVVIPLEYIGEHGIFAANGTTQTSFNWSRVAGFTIAASDEGLPASTNIFRLDDIRFIQLPPAPEFPAVSSIEATPASVSIDAGQSAAVTAAVYDQHHQAISGAPIVWSSDNPQVAVVAEGVITGVGQGSTTVRAAYGGLSAEVTVNVGEGLAASATLTGANQVEPGQNYSLVYGLSAVENVYAQDVVITYDPLVFQLLGAELLAPHTVIADTYGEVPGQVSYKLATLGAGNGLNGTLPVLELSFQARTAPASTILAVSAIILADGEGNEALAAPAEKTVSVGVVIDRSVLQAALLAAQEEEAAATEGYADGQYILGAKAGLQAAIGAARHELERPDSTQQDIVQAAEALNQAVLLFQSKRIAPSTGDVSGAGGEPDGRISVGDLGFVSARYGMTAADPGWADARKADIDGNGVIELYDLSFVARRMQ